MQYPLFNTWLTVMFVLDAIVCSIIMLEKEENGYRHFVICSLLKFIYVLTYLPDEDSSTTPWHLEHIFVAEELKACLKI